MISSITSRASARAEVVAVEQPCERLPGSRVASRKFRASSGPSGVSTDSGWNWTPSIGSSRWRTAITSPSVGGRRDLELVRDRASPRASGSGRPRSRRAARGRARARRGSTVARLAVDELAAPGRPRRRRPRRSPGARGRRRASARVGASRRTISSVAPDVRRAGPGPGETTRCDGAEPLGLVGVDLVVPADDDLGAELPEQVREVVGEAVVVVDEEDHEPRLRQVDRRLERRELAQALLVLGAPAPSRRRSRRPPAGARRRRASTIVRIAMQVSSAPPGQRVADRARVGPAPVALELGDQLHRPHLRRARDGAGREARAQQVERRRRRPRARRRPRRRGASRARSARARGSARPAPFPGAQTRERSLRPRSTSITCSARSFSEASSRSASPSPGGVVPAIGFRLARAALDLDERLRRRADQREAVELEQEEVRRRVDAPQRAVERRAREAGVGRSARCERTIWNASPARMCSFACSTPRSYSKRPGSAGSRRACAVAPRRQRGSGAVEPLARSRPRRRAAPPRARARGRSGRARRRRRSGSRAGPGPSSGSGTVGSSVAAWS